MSFSQLRLRMGLRMGFSVGVVGLVTLLVASSATAEPGAKRNPDTCSTAFDCGATSAQLAGKYDDYPGAFRAIRRGCEIETRAPIPGDALFACEQYAELLISAGVARGGDPPRGIAMLEQMCKARPTSTDGDVTPCNTLAREYDRPPKASGLPRRTDRAAVLQSAACDQGDAVSCSTLGDMYLKGGPGLPADVAKARAAMDKGCSGSDHYAAGVCGSIGNMLAEGKLGAAPDRQAAMPYLSKSCAQGYRCDLYVEFLLRDGRNDEAVRAFDQPRAFITEKDEWAQKYCREGFKVMCGRTKATKTATFRTPS